MKYFYIFSLLISCEIFSQVGINENTPLTSLHISASDSNNPSNIEGVIIPIVKNLNITDSNKAIGLLVFLDYENTNTSEIEKGFYWWNGTDWIPFFSMNKLIEDHTITYVSSLDTFLEGNLTSSNSNTRTILFNPLSLKANDTSNFEINSDNELVIKKAGTYHIQSTISLNSYTDSSIQARDSFEAKILLNDVEPTPNLRTAYGFPNGQASFNSNNVISGFIKLKANDRISIQINRYYRKVNSNVIIKPNGNMTNLTLRYMGNY